MRARNSSRFTYREWFFTTHKESLFDLSREELFIYRELIKGSA